MRNITKDIQNLKKININELLEDYDLDFSTFTDIDDRLLDIESKGVSLTLPERIILILYAEYHSYREIAKILGCSHSTIGAEIHKIREKLC